MYIWQMKEFPLFTYKKENIQSVIQELTLILGEVRGLMQGFSKEVLDDVFVQIMLSEAIQTSQIEGEYFSREDVISSLKMNLRLESIHRPTANVKADAVAKLMIEVKKDFTKPLTLQLLLDWHKILMSNENRIQSGIIRQGAEPMQVISGHYGEIEVHYEAPPSKLLPELLNQFIAWYQSFEDKEFGIIGDAMITSALAHLYFETLHPFEDGNGRIGRALAEKVLAERLDMPIFLNISHAIELDKKKYYEEIKKAQRDLNVSNWIVYFCDVLLSAIKNTKNVAIHTLNKTKFFDRYSDQLNKREIKAINKMFDAGPSGFEGGMTAKKYISINKTSKPTATRDLQHLTEIGAFTQHGGGRSVYYELNMEPYNHLF